MKTEEKFDCDIYDLAIQIARKEYKEYSSCYRCEAEDIAGDIYNFYLHYTKPFLYKAKDKKGFAVKGLYFALSSIRQLAISESKRFTIESEIYGGEFHANQYFQMLEADGKLHLWNDNEKLIDNQEKKQKSRETYYSKEPFTTLEVKEIWSILKSNLSERDFAIVKGIVFEGRSQEQIAKEHGITQQSVSKVLKKLSKLQNQFKDFI